MSGRTQMLGAWWLLYVRSLWNRLFAQFRRLKQPRYLLAASAAAAYFWLLLSRGFRSRSPLPEAVSDQVWLIAQVVGVVGAAVTIGASWLFGRNRASLTFTEAEIHWLFPAPLSRRQLLQFKLGKLMLGTLLGAVVSALFLQGGLPVNPAYFFLGLWSAISLLLLHSLAVSFARQGLLRWGPLRMPAPLLSLGALAWWTALVLFAAQAMRDAWPPPDPRDLSGWVTGVSTSEPLRWLIAPVLVPLQAAFAPDLLAFARAFGLALALLAFHVFWVLSSAVAFEEHAIVWTEERARAQEELARRREGLRFRRAKRSFRLGVPGPPAFAIAWKNAIGFWRSLGTAIVTLLAASLVPLVATVLTLGRGSRTTSEMVITSVWALALVFCVFLGPLALRWDFRRDWQNLEILRALPLRGAQLVAAQLAFPWLTLCTLFFVTLAGVLTSMPAQGWERLGAPLVWAVAASLVGVVPLFMATALLVQNGLAVLYPSWFRTTVDAPQGLEAIGQRLVTFFATQLLGLVSLLPATLLCGLAWLALWRPLGVAAIPAGACLGAVLLVVEVRLGIGLVGRLFERADVSQE